MEQKKKNLGGRPRFEINKNLFENLCEIQCTKEDICTVLGCNEKTLTRWCKDTYKLSFYDIYKKKSETGKSSLRRLQWKSAKKGNATMLIWLGKQYLGQSDKQEVINSGNLNLNHNLTKEEKEELLEDLKPDEV